MLLQSICVHTALHAYSIGKFSFCCAGKSDSPLKTEQLTLFSKTTLWENVWEKCKGFNVKADVKYKYVVVTSIR
jgi:hypothetical protein